MSLAVIGDFTIWQQGGGHPIAIGFVAFAIAVSLLLYRLRRAHPFRYGCIEISVGIIVLIFTFVPTTHYLAFDTQTFFEWGVTKLIGVMAGVYIIVRGLDNMDRDLPAGWRRGWDYWFPAKQKREPAESV